MDVPESTGILRFQVEGMDGIGGNQYKVALFTDDLLILDIHTAISRSNQIDLDGLVNMFGKGIEVRPCLIQGAYKRRLPQKHIGPVLAL